MPIVAVHIRRCDGRHADNAAFNADKDPGSVFQDGNYGRGWDGSSNGKDGRGGCQFKSGKSRVFPHHFNHLRGLMIQNLCQRGFSDYQIRRFRWR